MYKNNLVLSIKVADKFLKETNDTVYMPFLSEYSVFIKNKNNRKARVWVEIDGKDVLNGNTLIINPFDSIDLERFLENDLNNGRKFRFIEKTKEISEYRGDLPEDGLVSIRYEFEKQEVYSRPEPFINKPGQWFRNDGPSCESDRIYPTNDRMFEVHSTEPTLSKNLKITGMGIRSKECDFAINSFAPKKQNEFVDKYKTPPVDGGVNASLNSIDASDWFKPMTINLSFDDSKPKDGITVKGSESNQQFRKTFFFNGDGQIYSMTLKIQGQTPERTVLQPITKKTKKTCPSCGKEWAYEYTYCPNDATYLEEKK